MIALGTDSGPMLAPFWDPKSDQIGPKRVPKSIKKVIEKLVEFGIDFLTIFNQFWLPTWGAQGVQRIMVSASNRLPGPLWRQIGSLTSPRSNFDRSVTISGRFLIDSGHPGASKTIEKPTVFKHSCIFLMIAVETDSGLNLAPFWTKFRLKTGPRKLRQRPTEWGTKLFLWGAIFFPSFI